MKTFKLMFLGAFGVSCDAHSRNKWLLCYVIYALYALYAAHAFYEKQETELSTHEIPGNIEPKNKGSFQ